jgi:hypothetical protein
VCSSIALGTGRYTRNVMARMPPFKPVVHAADRVSLKNAQLDMWGCDLPEENVLADAETVSNASSSKKQKGANAKGPAPTAKYREAWCPCCHMERMMKPNKGFCETCNPDIETMRRDAKACSPKAKKMLADAEKASKKEKGCKILHDLWVTWKEEAGEATGMPRIGAFSWGRYEEHFAARTGSRN